MYGTRVRCLFSRANSSASLSILAFEWPQMWHHFPLGGMKQQEGERQSEPGTQRLPPFAAALRKCTCARQGFHQSFHGMP